MVGRHITAVLVAWCIYAAPAGAVDLSSEGGTASETPSVFDSGILPLAEKGLHLDETLRMGGRRLERPMVRPEEILAGRRASFSTDRRKRTIISVLCSAVLPGLGELYLYRETHDNGILARVPVFLAAEGYLWYGYAHNHSKGKDLKQDYMDYADEHWSLERFLTHHPCCAGLGGCDDWEYYNEYCSDDFRFFLYTPREMDEEEYYENIGKYDSFVYGWDDSTDPWDPKDYWSPHRTYYWSLREESDKYLLRADRHLMLLIVNRVVSMIDAGLLAYRLGEDDAEGWSLELEPGREAPVVNLCYRF